MILGEFNAGKNLLLVTIYFILLITIFNSIAGFSDEYSTALNSTASADINFEETFFCDEPRVEFYVSSDGSIESRRTYDNNIDCQATLGVYSENLCNGYAGCTWENETFFFFTTDTQTCKGVINTTYYNNGTLPPTGTSICDLANVADNQDNCNRFGCTWYRHSPISTNIENSGSIVSMLIGLTTFSYDFNLDDNVGVLEIFITLMFFTIPAIYFLICVYFLTPFAH